MPPLRYVDNLDGTITDLNSGLIWEKKCSGCGGLHDVDPAINGFTWFGIFSWIANVNAENSGAGYAGHNDWRIPNLRELLSIVHYGLVFPSTDSTLGPTALFAPYWSSSTPADSSSSAWQVVYQRGTVQFEGKSVLGPTVRAVRGP